MRKIALLILSLGLNGCRHIAKAPEVDLCQYNGTPRAFYCVNTETRAKEKRAASDPRMKAAQCLSADDSKTTDAYIDYLIGVARKRCQ